MPKSPSSAPITTSDLVEFLDKHDDFALEMFVYKAALLAGLRASHGGTYTDSVTKKHRQYDVRATAEREFRTISLALECKALRRSHPLLLCRIPRAFHESFHDIICSDAPSGKASLGRPLGFDDATMIAVKGARSLYKPNDLVAKHTVQVGRRDGQLYSADAEVFDKWSQALSSADDLVSSARYAAKEKNRLVLTFVMPVLVVADETLWAMDYSEDGVAVGEPRLIESGTLFVGRKYSSVFGYACTVSHLHICTRSASIDLLTRVGQDEELWENVFHEPTIHAALAG